VSLCIFGVFVWLRLDSFVLLLVPPVLLLELLLELLRLPSRPRSCSWSSCSAPSSSSFTAASRHAS
jgi:hypothetical protein